jgi:hypothetical protein
LVPTVGTALAFVIFRSNLPDKATVFAGVVAAVLSVSFFVQQQRLAEMNLFWELITAFNGRYDKLNERLMRIRCEDDSTDYQVVWDYFNLCAEEFLFFSEGYIDERVWRAWCIGMLDYFEVEPFLTMWRDVGARDSYYGLTLEEIRKGAALPT